MRTLLAAASLLFACSVSAEDLCFTNGKWFDGARFQSRTMCSSNGTLTAKRPRNARNVDLAGAFVVPPFGEAHNHNVESEAAATIARYLRSGVFYVKNPNSLPRWTPHALVNKPTSIDAVFAMGGLTGTGGHPHDVMKRNIDRGAATQADADGGFYHEVDTLADLERKWPLVLAQKPDFVKTYLIYSEEYAQRRNDPAKGSWKGLDPDVLPEIVRRARAAGLRVSTHVETAADFRSAVAAGVDEINHMPGFRAERNDLTLYQGDRFRIQPGDAKRAAARGVTVVTTVGSALTKAADPATGDLEARLRVRETIVHNLETLRAAGVKLAIGSDDYRKGVLPEVEELYALGVFSNRELLDLWSRGTSKAIFPDRRVGCVTPGCEASFLALEGDPLADFANTARIRMRVKSGVVLEVVAAP